MKTNITIQDEINIVNDYIINKMSAKSIATKYRIRQQRFTSILNKHGHLMRKSNDLRMVEFSTQEIETIKSLYLQFKSFSFVGDYMKIDKTVIKRLLIRLGIFEGKNGRIEGLLLEKLILLHGEQKGIELYNEYNNKKSIASSGKNNPMYGKPSPNGAGHGWKGWYKDFYFRSLREVSYLIYLDEENIKWESAENKRFTIKYINYDNSERTYRPDFFLPEFNKLVEIKPKRLQKSPLIILKTKAAQEFCANNNLTYQIMDFDINPVQIKIALENKTIKFDRDYEIKFLEYIKEK